MLGKYLSETFYGGFEMFYCKKSIAFLISVNLENYADICSETLFLIKMLLLSKCAYQTCLILSLMCFGIYFLYLLILYLWIHNYTKH